jgi:hypothetical protein
MENYANNKKLSNASEKLFKIDKNISFNDKW